jgi:mono/diheme cytochrome c family protein
MTMQRMSLLAVIMTSGLGWLVSHAVSVTAAPVNYQIPQEAAAFRPGPNLEVVQGNCTACHSADYVNTQPPMKNKKDFWQAEVTKMIKVYGAPIDDADVGKIVDYLASTY